MRQHYDTFDQLYYGAYLKGAEEWARSRGRLLHPAMERDVAMIVGMRPRTVLDWGCGRGELMAAVASRLHQAGEPIRCFGYDPVALSSAYRAQTFAELEVEHLCQSYDSTWPIPDKIGLVDGFDLLVLRNVFECIDPEAVPRNFEHEVRKTCNQLRVLLRKGGTILLKTPWSATSLVFKSVKWEAAYAAWRAAGAARQMVPWHWIDAEGRLYLDEDHKYPEGVQVWSRRDLYETLTVLNAWPGSALELAAKFFPGMKAECDLETGWLALGGA